MRTSKKISNARTCRWYTMESTKFLKVSTTFCIIWFNGDWRHRQIRNNDFQFSIESISSFLKHLLMFWFESIKIGSKNKSMPEKRQKREILWIILLRKPRLRDRKIKLPPKKFVLSRENKRNSKSWRIQVLKVKKVI